MSRVSHELRTPLNGILGFAQLLQARADVDPVQRSWIEAILASGRHMLELVFVGCIAKRVAALDGSTG